MLEQVDEYQLRKCVGSEKCDPSWGLLKLVLNAGRILESSEDEEVSGAKDEHVSDQHYDM